MKTATSLLLFLTLACTLASADSVYNTYGPWWQKNIGTAVLLTGDPTTGLSISNLKTGNN